MSTKLRIMPDNPSSKPVHPHQHEASPAATAQHARLQVSQAERPPKGGMSLTALRLWTGLSAIVMGTSIVMLLCIYTDDGPADTILHISAWCTFLASALNGWNFYSNLRSRQAKGKKQASE